MKHRIRIVAFGAVMLAAIGAQAADIGQVKIASGKVDVERAGASRPAIAGTRLQAGDVVRTGADGAVGITMSDDSRLSAGPNSVLALDRYAYDPSTSGGQFDASLKSGSLAVASGRIAKQSPDAMRVRTPMAILGVRGTEFAVALDEPAPAPR